MAAIEAMILDTCALLWLAAGDKHLSRTALKKINESPAAYVSAISGFEIGLKAAKKKLKLPLSPKDWFERVGLEESLMAIPLSRELRCFHLISVFRDLVERLRTFKPLGTKEPMSVSAAEHGLTRRKQGYTAAMMVEESRVLQVSIFNTLQNNLASIDFSVLLIGVMTIADEVDSQLSLAMTSYIAESLADALPA